MALAGFVTEPFETEHAEKMEESSPAYRNVGAIANTVTLDAPSLDGPFPALRHDLGTALVAQGL